MFGDFGPWGPDPAGERSVVLASWPWSLAALGSGAAFSGGQFVSFETILLCSTSCTARKRAGGNSLGRQFIRLETVYIYSYKLMVFISCLTVSINFLTFSIDFLIVY